MSLLDLYWLSIAISLSFLLIEHGSPTFSDVLDAILFAPILSLIALFFLSQHLIALIKFHRSSDGKR